jgi:histidyl-tRNA synthetase
MNKENKLVPGLPSGFEDRWDKKLLLKKKLLKAIENNFIKFGAEALETPSFEISENIGSFLAEEDSNPMSDVFSFQDGEKSITLRYDLSSPLARFVAQNNQELPSIFINDMQFKMYFVTKKLEMVVTENLCKPTLISLEMLILPKQTLNSVT